MDNGTFQGYYSAGMFKTRSWATNIVVRRGLNVADEVVECWGEREMGAEIHNKV